MNQSHEHQHDHAHEQNPEPGHGHEHQTPHSPLEPAVDAETGKLELSCSRCGADVAPGEEFCQICALEMSGGEVPSTDEET